MLLDHLLLWKVNLSLLLFIICSCLLACLLGILPVFCLVSFLECHANSLTVTCYQSLLNCSHLWRIVIVRLFLQSGFLFGLQYQSIILAAKNFKFSCIISKNAVSSFDICVISMASIIWDNYGCSMFSVPAVKILYFFPIPTGLFRYSYGSWTKIKSGSSFSVTLIML